MIQVDHLAEMAEELRRRGVEACHEILYGPAWRYWKASMSATTSSRCGN